jgi:CheY-like chemotaxis protein
MPDLMLNLDGQRILLVDDNTHVRDIITKMLQSLNTTVVQAEDCSEALALYQSRSFDAVLTDYDLPGMTGDDLAEAIKSIDPSQRVILLSGRVGRFLDTCRVPVRFDLVLSKPCTQAQLSLALQYHTVPAPLPAAHQGA